MDLELEDSESDSGLLPPGVDQTPLEEPVAQVSCPADVIRSSWVEKGVKQVGNNTPTQESIWSMLEHSSAISDSHSNLVDNQEEEKIAKVPISVRNFCSFFGRCLSIWSSSVRRNGDSVCHDMQSTASVHMSRLYFFQ